MNVDEQDIALKVEKRTSGFRVRFRGADMVVNVRSPRQAELAKLMLEQKTEDTTKLLLCPMPGLIVKVDVTGAEVSYVSAQQSTATLDWLFRISVERRSGGASEF